MRFLEVGHRAAQALASGAPEVLMEFSRGEVWRCGSAIVWLDCDPEAFSPCGVTVGCEVSRLRGHEAAAAPQPRNLVTSKPFEAAIDHFMEARDPNVLIGLGHGLTPAGDDFLGGYLFVRHRLGHPEIIDTSGTHEISRARLAMHMNGEGTRAEVRFVDALLGEGDVDVAAAVLRHHGHSSGDDFMRGARVAFELR